jgi:hypothetical protein
MGSKPGVRLRPRLPSRDSAIRLKRHHERFAFGLNDTRSVRYSADPNCRFSVAASAASRTVRCRPAIRLASLLCC